jgi:putative heme-binding domain-containing protein
MKKRGSFLAAAVAVLCTGVARGAAPAPSEKYVTYAMTHAGDVERGKALFFDERRLGCSRCHAVDGKGANAGPNLFAIGDKFGRRELVESIVAPSATIAEDYGTMIVTTRSGDVLAGIVKESTADHVALVGADGQVTRLEARDIRDRRASLVSMMPEGLQNGLSFAEFDDLIEYLASLKTAETIASAVHGMPATIAETQAPVVLRPVHLPEHHFSHPVWFGRVPGVAGAFAVVEHETGKVWLLDKLGEAGERKSVFFDNAPAMRGAHGIMSVVFHPRYAENRRYFLVRQPVERGMFYTEIMEGRATKDLRADSGQPLRHILTIDASSANHPGGGLEFGPDGYLYIGMGDTGPQQDPHGNAQAMNLLRGKMLRIDVDHAEAGKAYAVPKDNPFVGRAGVRPEIWAAGLREPWRYSFDPETGELWVGDVGQDLYEEVDVVKKGENYGWNVIEGFAPFSNQYRRQGERFSPPVFAYGRKYGVSVTGGYVYRGDRASALYGAYIFGDFQSRRIFALTREGTALKTVRQIGLAPQRIVSFSRGPAGALYLVGYEGTVYRMELEHASLK